MVRHAVAILASVLLVLGLVAPGTSASDSLTWGYDYSRARLSPIPEELVSTDALSQVPFVVPDPNPADRSQSTPIVVGQTGYFFAFDSGTHGSLYQFGLTADGPTAAQPIASFTASNSELYNSPGDPSISPDGRWLAYAAGKHLYWWRVDDWTHTSWGLIPNAPGGGVAYVSSAPLFVPDPTPGSGGWDACSGSANGGFGCYQVGPGIPTTIYATGDGAPITSSAVSVSSSQACFGVAAPAPRARVVCLDPYGSSLTDDIGAGVIREPVDAALAYANGALYVTDRVADVYRIDPATGKVLAQQTATSNGGTSIAPPAVDGGVGIAYVVAWGYSTVCALDAASLAPYFGTMANSCVPPTLTRLLGAGGLTAVTATPIETGYCQGDVVWTAGNGGLVGGLNICEGNLPVLAFSAPADTSGGHNFSAVVAGVGPGSAYVALWSDTAVDFWSRCPEASFCAGQPARLVGPHGTTGGGLEIWRLTAPLVAWFELDPAYSVPPNGGPEPYGECLLALARPGEFASLTATLPDGSTVPMHTDSTYAGQITATDWPGGGTGPLFEDGVTGCPNLPRTSYYFSDAMAGYHSRQYPHATDGTDPAAMAGPYQLWAAAVPAVPGTAGPLPPATVTGTAADGSTLTVNPVLYTICPTGDTEGQNGGCTAPPPLPKPSCPPGTHLDPTDDTCQPNGFAPVPQECVGNQYNCTQSILWGCWDPDTRTIGNCTPYETPEWKGQNPAIAGAGPGS